jgi:iron complex transport system ATP-binding protein
MPAASESRSHPVLELRSVDVVRGTTSILENISLIVDQGEHTAILGPNGSGKSTLLKLLMRMMYPSIVAGKAGQMRMFGETEWNVWELRTKLGFVSSELDHHFIGGRSGRLSALQTVLTGLFSSELEPDPEAITPSMLNDARDALGLMEIDHLADRSVGHMSTGERRRVLLARALIHRPIALVLDEPTSGLDVRAQAQLLRRLDALSQWGTTLILVTHHFQEVIPCIQRTLLLGGGRIAFDGPTAEAMTSQRLSQVFGVPLQSHRSASGFWNVTLGDG